MTDHLRGTLIRQPRLLRLWGRDGGRWYAHACDEAGRDTSAELVDLGVRAELDAKAEAVDRVCGLAGRRGA